MNAVSSLHRLTSMNDVLTLQEEKLEPTSSTNQEKRQSLLNCWRTKVYDLLMQLKSMELVLKNGSSKFSNGKTTSKPLISGDVCVRSRFRVHRSTFFRSLCSETFDRRQRVKHCERHSSLFFVQIWTIARQSLWTPSGKQTSSNSIRRTQSSYSVCPRPSVFPLDCFAAFRYLESKLNQSDSNLSLVLHENTSLKERLQSYEHTEGTIRELMIKYSHQPQYDELFKTINRTLSVYEQRLGYINKRFLVLQTLFNRQLLSLTSKQQTTVAIQTEDEQYIDVSLLEPRTEQSFSRTRSLGTSTRPRVSTGKETNRRTRREVQERSGVRQRETDDDATDDRRESTEDRDLRRTCLGERSSNERIDGEMDGRTTETNGKCGFSQTRVSSENGDVLIENQSTFSA